MSLWIINTSSSITSGFQVKKSDSLWKRAKWARVIGCETLSGQSILGEVLKDSRYSVQPLSNKILLMNKRQMSVASSHGALCTPRSELEELLLTKQMLLLRSFLLRPFSVSDPGSLCSYHDWNGKPSLHWDQKPINRLNSSNKMDIDKWPFHRQPQWWVDSTDIRIFPLLRV